MRFLLATTFLLLAGATGCTTPPEPGTDGSAATRPASPPSAPAPTSAKPAAARRVQPRDGDPASALPVYEVRESAFTDFGMSVKTNVEVKWGDAVAWMEVSSVAPDSSAAKKGLRPGDRILALDGELITKFGRDSMLEALFQRKAGERAELLVMNTGQALPHYVTLTAAKPRLAR